MNAINETQARSSGSDTVTEGIRIQASAQLLEEESDADALHWRYSYRIVMTNEGPSAARLLSRHWIILDANNQRDEVRGAGVVGQTPRLAPGERHEYMSSCPLRTPWGTMEGSYLFQRDDGTKFEVAIGRFFLVPPKSPAK